MADSEVRTARRHRLLKSQAARSIGDAGLSALWLGKHDATAATALPTTFPSREALAAAHYTAVEDLDGATEDELAEQAGLSRASAREALAALTTLL